MGTYSEYFLGSSAAIVQLELIEISHPNFTKPYRIVRNIRDGVTVDLSPEELAIDFEYYPARITQVGARDNLDSSIQIELGDLGEIIPTEIDAVALSGGFLTKPMIRYWTFRSDMLDQPIFGPIILEATTFSFSDEGSGFEARAPTVNATKTGERFTIDRFPMLAGFV